MVGPGGTGRARRWWAAPVVVLALVVTGIATGVGILLLDPGDSRPPGRANLAAPSPAPTAPAPRSVAVIGDSYSAGGVQGGLGRRGWPAILARRLGVPLSLVAVSGTGWVNPGDHGDTFLVQARALSERGARPDLVIVFGSRNDQFYPGERVRAAAIRTLRYLRRSQRQADVVVIGPTWPSQYPPVGRYVDEIAPSLLAAATTTHVAFVDPMAGRPWFDATNDALVAADHVHPNDDGHRYLAGRIHAALQRIGALPDS